MSRDRKPVTVTLNAGSWRVVLAIATEGLTYRFTRQAAQALGQLQSVLEGHSNTGPVTMTLGRWVEVIRLIDAANSQKPVGSDAMKVANDLIRQVEAHIDLRIYGT